MDAEVMERSDKDSYSMRNMKQLYNINSELKKFKQPEDDLALVEYDAITLPEFVPDKRRYKGKLIVVTRHPEMDNHIAQLLKAGNKLVFGYDTTFKVSNMHASLLLFRHPYLKYEKSVVCGCIFHESKDQIVHKMMFENKLDEIKALNSPNVTFVTDREDGIQNAIKSVFPKAKHFVCFIHIEKNVKIWCAANIGQEMATTCVKDVKRLLFSTSRENYDKNYNVCQNRLENSWPDSFVSYYKKNLEEDILKSYKGATSEEPCFHPFAGITTNQSESMNAKFKELLAPQPRPLIESLKISVMEMTNYLHDIRKSLTANDGDFQVKPHCFEKLQLVQPKAQKDYVTKAGLDSIFNSGHFYEKPENSFRPTLHFLQSKEGLAKLLIQRNRVKIVGENLFVEGFHGRTYAVDLAKMSCTCRRVQCEHLLAVVKVTGMESWSKSPKANTAAVKVMSITKVASYYRNPNDGRKLNELPRKRIRMLKRLDDSTKTLLAARRIKLVNKQKRSQSDADVQPQHAFSPTHVLGETTSTIVPGVSNANVKLGIRTPPKENSSSFDTMEKSGREQKSPSPVRRCKRLARQYEI